MFCSKCGAKASLNAAFCHMCGNELMPAADFSRAAGTLDNADTTVAAAADDDDDPEMQKLLLSDKWVWALALFPILIGLLCWLEYSVWRSNGILTLWPLIMNFGTFFVHLDRKELDKRKMFDVVRGRRWVVAGGLLPPWYIFVRASQTNKKIVPAIISGVLYTCLTFLYITRWVVIITFIAASGRFTDSRDGKIYPTVKIRNQTWIAKNLNYQTGQSWCYDDNDANCKKYGRLYDWNTAMEACPAGWRLPDTTDWNTLENAVGGIDVAGAKLKTASGWGNDGNGTNKYGFSALPGGRRHPPTGSFHGIGYNNFMWSATERGRNRAVGRSLLFDTDKAIVISVDKEVGLSVRCVAE